MKKSLLLLTPLLLVLQYGYGQRPPSEKFAAAFAQFQREAGLSNNQAAFAVMDGKRTDPVFEHQGKTGMATASTLKVITSITAMDLLGVDFDYQTILGYTGSIDQSGVLHGDLIIKGSGDPTLGSDRYASTKPKNILDNWTFALIKLGIKRIKGRVIGDDLIFGGNQVPTGWPAGDIGNYYGAGISGLNWKENKAGITFSPAAVGQAAGIAKLTDDLSYLTMRNEVRTGNPGSGDKVYGYSSPYAQTILLKGTYGKDLRKTIEISVPDPAYQLARDLKTNMEFEGIIVEGIAASAFKLSDYRKEPLRTVATHHSPKLPEILYWFNHKSINLYGEALLKSIGKEKNNVHSTAAAADYLSAYWHKTLSIPRAELGILDGCGLSPDNRVTAQAMTQIMRYAKSQPWYTEFYKSLPTINQMKMKSGTIGGVLGYTGYQRAAEGQEWSFTLFVNNYKGSASQMRQRMFKFLNVLKQ